MKIIFVGPSLHRDLAFLRRRQDDIVWAGPARCGDIARAARSGVTAIALVDGLFDQSAAPWHKEVLYALSLGLPVAGGASMGALRAAECAAFGMTGIGTIYQRYASGEIVDDAEVAQLHAPEELNYLPLTEPLVNVEPTLSLLDRQGAVHAATVQSLAAAARQIHYSERTYAEMIRRSADLDPEEAQTAGEWLQSNAVDQKRMDALEVLDWLRAQPDREPSPAHAWDFQETTQWMQLLHAVKSE
ncbi:TfuA-like protein [Dongia sp.]|uniref:TfuA-like protein n=1 Tax=Dongia sp. TaxID=1977262 RepID=UPI00375130CC